MVYFKYKNDTDVDIPLKEWMSEIENDLLWALKIELCLLIQIILEYFFSEAIFNIINRSFPAPFFLESNPSILYILITKAFFMSDNLKIAQPGESGKS